VFASAFSEGDTGPTLRTNAQDRSRRIIQTEENFEILHTLVYYLYTKKVYLKTKSTLIGPPSVPAYCDAEEIFAIAHRYDLQELKEKVLIFLRDTCKIENIVGRVFSEFAILYDEVGELYEAYFRRHWDEIRQGHELDWFFDALERENSPRIWKVCKRFAKLMKDP
jgi:hypothetical protein